MTRRLAVLLAAFMAAAPFPVLAQNRPALRAPALTGFAIFPTSTDTCNPVRLTFTVTNSGREPILSQSPYARFVYPLYGSFSAMGLRSLPDRYMIGVSLDGGRDGYPFRWGYPGQLSPGRSVTIAGLIAIPEVGEFTFTPVLLKGDTVVSRLRNRSARATVHLCRPSPLPRQRFAPPTVPLSPPPVIPPEALYPYPPPVYVAPPPMGGAPVIRPIPPAGYWPGGYPAFVPYNFGGRLLVSAAPFVYTLGAELTLIDGKIIIRKPGVDLILFAGTQHAILNGVPIYIPTLSEIRHGVPYVPPQFVSPILGATVWVDPITGIVYINGPARY